MFRSAKDGDNAAHTVEGSGGVARVIRGLADTGLNDVC